MLLPALLGMKLAMYLFAAANTAAAVEMATDQEAVNATVLTEGN